MGHLHEDQLIIRRTEPADIDAVLDFYAKMIEAMRGTDFDILWKYDEHPTIASLVDAVDRAQMYIGVVKGTVEVACKGTAESAADDALESENPSRVEDGCIACAAVVNHEQADGYEKVPWRIDASLDEIGIVHSVVTHPAYHGRGFATQLMRALIDGSRADGMLSLRLDTFTTNVRSRGLYGKLGFHDMGAWPIFYDDLGLMDLQMFEYIL